MKSRVEIAEKLFMEGYNCSQSVFAAFSDLYEMDQDTALKLSTSFGGGLGRMREVCGAVSGMGMIAGLETGTSKKMDDEGKKYNYEVVQKLANEFKEISGSIICRELLGLEKEDAKDATPQQRNQSYYNTRPCVQLVKDAADIVEQALYAISIEPVVTPEQIREVAILAEEIWHDHYDPLIGEVQVNYMLDKFQSEEAMIDQITHNGYQYFKLVSLGGLAGYLAIREDQEGLFLSKFYIAPKFRGRGYARKALNFIEQLCRDKKLERIWLTVNKGNLSSIGIYEKLGFVKYGTLISDIGEGFVMDDDTMEKYIGNLN